MLTKRSAFKQLLFLTDFTTFKAKINKARPVSFQSLAKMNKAGLLKSFCEL